MSELGHINEWTQVLSSPLGLVSYALFLVFGFLAKVKSSSERRWVAPAAMFLACTALLGGLGIAYRQVELLKKSPPPVNAVQPPDAQKKQTNSQVQQTSTGTGSSNVQGVQGDVTISVDQSAGKAELHKSARKKPK